MSISSAASAYRLRPSGSGSDGLIGSAGGVGIFSAEDAFTWHALADRPQRQRGDTS